MFRCFKPFETVRFLVEQKLPKNFKKVFSWGVSSWRDFFSWKEPFEVGKRSQLERLRIKLNTGLNFTKILGCT